MVVPLNFLCKKNYSGSSNSCPKSGFERNLECACERETCNFLVIPLLNFYIFSKFVSMCLCKSLKPLDRATSHLLSPPNSRVTPPVHKINNPPHVEVTQRNS